MYRYGSLAERVVPGKSPSRSDFPLVPSRCALLIIDIQEHLPEPMNEEEKSSYLFKEALPRAVKNIQQLLIKFRVLRDQESSARGREVNFLPAWSP